MGQVLDKLWGPNSHDELTSTVEFEGVHLIRDILFSIVAEC